MFETIAVVLLPIGFLVWVISQSAGYELPVTKRRRIEREQQEEEEEEKKERRILESLREDVHSVFCVEMDTIHESITQDEIIRVVNLMAYQTAVACVNEDKVGRGKEPIESEFLSYNSPGLYGGSRRDSWRERVTYLKIEWSKTRKLALQIAPKLADRMPHFSEFEPLKGYNSEHLREKQAKKTAI